MNARATWAIVRKDVVEIVLNRSALVTVLSPIFLALLFAVLNALLSGQTTAVLIYNPGGAAAEQVLLNGPWPNVVVTRAASAEQVAAAFAVPSPTYAAGLAAPAGQPLTLYLDGGRVDAATGQLLASALAGYASGAARVTVVSAHPQPPPSRTELSSYLSMFGLMSSFIVSAAVVAGLLLEEKEHGTLRLLLAPPGTLGDVVAGKLLVGLGYQLLLVLAVLAIQRGFVGQTGLVLAFGLLGTLLGLAAGLLYGSLAKNTNAFGAFVALVSAVYTVPALFVGPLGQALAASPLVRAMQVFPTYYLARGIFDALEGRAAAGATLLAMTIVAGSAVVVFAAAVWPLRRLAAELRAL